MLYPMPSHLTTMKDIQRPQQTASACAHVAAASPRNSHVICLPSEENVSGKPCSRRYRSIPSQHWLQSPVCAALPPLSLCSTVPRQAPDLLLGTSVSLTLLPETNGIPAKRNRRVKRGRERKRSKALAVQSAGPAGRALIMQARMRDSIPAMRR